MTQRAVCYSRRSLVLGAAAAMLLPHVSLAATPDGADIEKGMLPFPIVGGTLQPTVTEASVANDILRRVPRTSPLAIMRYFETLKIKNKDGEAFNGGWRTRWNPIIVQFFEQTATTPAGDTTSWCAASLNWALARSGMSRGTHSASSGSFRDAPGLTSRPRPGDIVVFGATDPSVFAQGRGHVGLFLAQRADAVLVLGGNQTDTLGHHTFCRKWLDKQGPDLTLHSFHRISAFA